MKPTLPEQIRVAIVDDDDGTRALMRDLLTDESYTVVLWSGDDDPVAFVNEASPDLVLLDLRLGGRFQAWDVIDALCGDGSVVQVPVIICSADRNLIGQDIDRFHERGCAVVEKPFDLETLLDTVRASLTASGPQTPDDGHAT